MFTTPVLNDKQRDLQLRVFRAFSSVARQMPR